MHSIINNNRHSFSEAFGINSHRISFTGLRLRSSILPSLGFLNSVESGNQPLIALEAHSTCSPFVVAETGINSRLNDCIFPSLWRADSPGRDEQYGKKYKWSDLSQYKSKNQKTVFADQASETQRGWLFWKMRQESQKETTYLWDTIKLEGDAG